MCVHNPQQRTKRHSSYTIYIRHEVGAEYLCSAVVCSVFFTSHKYNIPVWCVVFVQRFLIQFNLVILLSGFYYTNDIEKN